MSNPERRSSRRRKPDTNALCHIDSVCETEEFRADLLALVINESAGGCSLVTVKTPTLMARDTLRIKPGKLNPIQARVIWRIELDSDVIKLGVEYV